MNRSAAWAVPTAAIAVLALIVSLNSAAGSAGGTTAAAGPQEIAVTLTEYAISPGVITAEPGRPIRASIHNAGAIEHNLAIPGTGTSPMLASGADGVLDLPSLEAGTYEFLCTVPGHADLGMRATLEVRAGGGGVTAPSTPNNGAPMTPEQMDASYMAGVQAFLEDKPEPGGRPMTPRMDGNVKVFELTAEDIRWEVAPGQVKEAMAYNRQIPGPEIRVSLGERVRVVLHNKLHESSSLHLHGLEVPNDQDGVPGLTEDIVKPGDTKIYEFTVPNAGSHMYHAHMASQRQVPMGLLGAFIVEGPDEPEVDVDYTMILGDGPLGFTINGRGFPWTQMLTARPGQTVRIRYMNEGLQGHPMHLHGMNQQVIAMDGWPVPAPWRQDTVWVAPGQRVDVLVTTRPGLWAFHCHILTHAEDDSGYIGMTTVFAVQ